MVRIDLTRSEATVLQKALSIYLSDLRMEISHTDSFAYREGLKQTKVVLQDIADRLTVRDPEVLRSGS